MSDKETYLAHAAQFRAEAASTTLANVRERCLRSEAAWNAMADRARNIEELRDKRNTDAAARKAAEVD